MRKVKLQHKNLYVFQETCLPILPIPAAQVLFKPTLFYSCKEHSTNLPIFMQNKANFCKAEINVSSLI